MNAKTLYETLKNRLQTLGVHDPAYEARYIMAETLTLSWSDIISAAPASLTPEATQTIENILTQRADGKPLSRIYGQKEFWGLRFHLNEATLDPRPDTEVLVEKARAFLQDQGESAPHILDMGTGTGCIIISLLRELPHAQGMAVDFSPQALVAARQNAEDHNVLARLQLKESDWFSAVDGQFDCIVSNPPYIDPHDIANLSPEVQNHDPILALDGGEKGTSPYEIIFSQIKNHLKPHGRAFFEIGAGQCGYIQGIAEKYRIRICAIYPDYAGIPRVVEISCGDK